MQTRNTNDNYDDDDRHECDCSLAAGDLLEASSDRGSRRTVRITVLLHDIVMADLAGSDHTQLARTEDGGWLLHESYWEDWERPEGVQEFVSEAALAQFLWQRRRPVDLLLLYRLGHLALKP